MVWPLDFVKSVKVIKVFGIFVQDSYRAMIKTNWDFRFTKFNNCVKTWSARNLPSLLSRVEVLKVFALSRVYYVASILPITKTMVKKFESIIGKFIWKGRLLRVALAEIKNSKMKGGLDLVCLQSMSSSLLVSQFLRLLKSSDNKSINHAAYWIGDGISLFLPGMDSGLHHHSIPDFFAHIESLLLDGRVDDLITENNWRSLTNRILYQQKTVAFPLPKVEIEAGFSYRNAWFFINLPIFSSSEMDIMYLLLHKKLPIPEILFRIGLRNDPYCLFCPDAPICDTEHFFCSCLRVSEVWHYVRDLVNHLVEGSFSNWELINFVLPRCTKEKEAVWLLGNYLVKVWAEVSSSSMTGLNKDSFFGFLKFKYRTDQKGARHTLPSLLPLLQDL